MSKTHCRFCKLNFVGLYLNCPKCGKWLAPTEGNDIAPDKSYEISKEQDFLRESAKTNHSEEIADIQQHSEDAMQLFDEVKRFCRTTEAAVNLVNYISHHEQRLIKEAELKARIDAAKSILKYRSYNVGKDQPKIVMPKDEVRRFVDEFDINGFIGQWSAELKALQEPNK